jgi:hypothetical protein
MPDWWLFRHQLQLKLRVHLADASSRSRLVRTILIHLKKEHIKTLMTTLLSCTLIVLSGCLGGDGTTDSSSNGNGTCSFCGWSIEVQSIQTISGNCAFNDCGYGSYSSCSLIAVMDVQEPSVGQIKLDPWIPGLLHGLYFEGTLDTSTGTISTTHEAFPDSTLLAGWDLVNDTMGGQIYWKPNATCEAVIDFTGVSNN